MMAQFENFIPPVASVIRSGKLKQIDAKDIVPGDICVVKGGESIPCDIVAFRANEMRVNNSSLTGEFIEIEIDMEIKPAEFIMESNNVMFFGTLCTAGEATGICIKTGNETVIGNIANLAASA